MRARTFAFAVAATAAATVGIALARLKRPDARGARRSPQETYRCACGQGFRVTGTGRHRVFWLEGAPDSDPLLSPACPTCERSLV
jgi:hypothetical protein